MPKLLYISSLSQNSQSGGANAVNFHTYKELEKHFRCTYIQINPKEPKLGKWKSQVLRKVLKKPGCFNYFSQRRLQKIAQSFNTIEGEYDIIFFRGFTPWIACQPTAPYFAYNDVHFLQFFKNTFTNDEFIKNDIDRISLAEKKWLIKAEKLFFESQWGADQCHDDYAIETAKLLPIGRGGNIPIPKKDTYSGSLNLVVIANNFYQKGGDLVFEAFRQLKQKHPQMQLHIVGGDPGEAIKNFNGVRYFGVLRKENPKDLLQLQSILSKAFLLMHITREDTNPLVITEAGYFGCPTISVNHFAIPELVVHNKTGMLLDYLPKPKGIAAAVESLILDKESYFVMRKTTAQFNKETFAWNQIGEVLKTILNKDC